MLKWLGKKLRILRYTSPFRVLKSPWWLITICFLIFILVIVLGYWFKWDWTGLNEHIGPNVQQYQPRKTLWDWLNLLGVLAIPVAVGFGSLWFTAQQSKTQEAANEDNQRERLLQDYIAKMSDLLLKENLQKSVPKLSIDNNLMITGIETKIDKEVQIIARARTLTVLSRLDGKRKKSLIQFLHESGLIEKNGCIINLSEADLIEADLSLTNLKGANLNKATLIEADLENTNLKDAIGITPEQLAQVKSLKGTIMPDGSSLKRPGNPHSFATSANIVRSPFIRYLYLVQARS
jgi:hypothetical protein